MSLWINPNLLQYEDNKTSFGQEQVWQNLPGKIILWKASFCWRNKSDQEHTNAFNLI